MATAVRRRRAADFNIHEDVPSTGDTEMNTDALAKEEDGDEEEGEEDEEEDDDNDDDDDEYVDQADQNDSQEPVVEDYEEDDESDEDDTVDDGVQMDMKKLEGAFAGFKHQYRLIKRIGEGTFSTVYKAEDLQYDRYESKWDLDKENEKWTPPPLKRHTGRSSSATLEQTSQLIHNSRHRRRPKFVAIKKIYVTSSPSRILNELELLHDLRDCPAICPLITAFRSTDQVIAILPYFRHQDFRDYFRNMTVPDVAVYMRSLFTALEYTHAHKIIHRDIKPTNFLYDPTTQRGVLVDFGLAEREGADAKPCLCHEDPVARRARLRAAVSANGGPYHGYPKNDTRPSRRANRAGTRGFRAPEVLFKCTEQTTKIDIWSAGVVLLTIMSRRFPFFNSADDVDAMIEIADIFGYKRMRLAGQLHGCMFETTIPSIGGGGFDLGKIIMWSTLRDEKVQPFTDEELMALDFLSRCLDLDPSKRLAAHEALDHEFLRIGTEGGAGSEEEDMDILRA